MRKAAHRAYFLALGCFIFDPTNQHFGSWPEQQGSMRSGWWSATNVRH